MAESQKVTLQAALGERVDGSWAASRVGDFGPRQGTGKSDKIAARELAGLILFGEKLIIHTAHEFPTANESFLRLAALFENWDDLSRLVEHIYYANGAQAIHLKGGRRILYKARTGGAGRGFAKADLVVYDEAQHLSREHVAASGPAKMANPNAQTWYAGSGGFTSSAVAWAMRRAALLGSGGRLAYTEMTGETVSIADGRVSSVAPDPLDRDVWYRAIPGLGRWVSEEAVEGLYDELGSEAFLREILCVWDPEPTATDDGDAFSAAAWAKLADPTAERGQDVVFGVDISEDRLAHVAVGWCRSDGAVHVMLADTGLSPLATAGRLAELAAAWGGLVVLGGTSASLEAEVDGATVMSGTEFVAACGDFEDRLKQGQLRHGNQPDLNRAVRDAQWRRAGTSGGRALRLAGAPTVGPLAAVVRALHGVNAGLAEKEPLFAIT